LGSNGSGKTTTVRILTTLLAPNSGSARIAGRDIVREAPAVREAIGLTAQETVIDRFLTAEEYLSLIARLRHVPRRRRAEEVADLLTEFDLDEISQTRVDTYSGGMRRRLDIAASFVGRPSVLFLDEPSNGLDPRTRMHVWEAIRKRAHGVGATVLLTTQYMEEADILADSIVVLARGRVVTSGAPIELKEGIGDRVVELIQANAGCAERAKGVLAALGISSTVTANTVEFVLTESNPSILASLQRLDTEGIDVSATTVRTPTLDEAFLHITGTAEAAYADGQLAEDAQ
jgi:ABC-type multidrug transport system ATPase subunit